MPALVLVVEDDPAVRSLLVDLLRGEGFSVRTAVDELQAADAYAVGPPDLLVVDLNARMGGDRGLRAMLREPRLSTLPVVVFVADAAFRWAINRGRYAEATASEIAELLQTIRSLLSALRLDTLRPEPLCYSHSPFEAPSERDAFLDYIRWVAQIEPVIAADPFVASGGPLLDSFRRLLTLRESEPDAVRQLATILARAEPPIGNEAERTGPARDERVHRTLGALVRRSFRQVHSAALGACAATMWSFPDTAALQHWRHANATGFLVLQLCAHDPTLRDQAFAAGLLHDLGRLALSRQGEGHPAPPQPYEALYAHAQGKAVAEGLGLPVWSRDALRPCGFGVRGSGELGAIVSAACRVAGTYGFVGSHARRSDQAEPELVREITRAIEETGGASWLEAKVQGPAQATSVSLQAVLALA